MGFLDNLLNRNPTADWRPAAGFDLVLDLDDESFCGIRLGERADRLRKFGPADDAAAARNGSYRYLAKGFDCLDEQGRFAEVEIGFGGSDARPFAGVVRRNGTAATFGPDTGEADLAAHLGKPDERAGSTDDEDGSTWATLTWRLQRTDCVAEYADGRLESLWLGLKQ